VILSETSIANLQIKSYCRNGTVSTAC